MTRTKTTLAVAAGLFLLASAGALADPPELKSLAPSGAQRGVATEVVVTGSNLAANPRMLAPFVFTVEPGKAEAGSWKPKVTVAADVPVGIYPVRVQTDEGLSSPLLFSVGQVPQVADKEENSTFETAQPISAPAVVEGQTPGNDVDFFKFKGRKGERIIIDAQCARIGSSIDPSIRLTTAAHGYVASADDSPGLLTDARLSAVLPEDGEYVVELSDSRYQGGAQPIYRLLVGALPAPEEVYPLGGRHGETVGFEFRGGTVPGTRVAAATLVPEAGTDQARLALTNQLLGLAGPTDPVYELESLAPVVVSDLPELREPADPTAPPARTSAPVVLNGRIDPAGDEDRFALSVTPGQRLRFRVHAAQLGSALDGQLQILNPKGNALATADDTNMPPLVASKKANQQNQPTVSPDPSLDFTVPGGTTEIVVALKDLEGRGGVGYPYRLTVEPVVPSFELRVDDGQVSIPKGGTAAVDVAITRQGYNGPITLTVLDPPAGLTVGEGKVADGQAVGVLTLSAKADAAFNLAHLRVVGKADGPEGPIVRPAMKPLIFAMQATLPTNVVMQEGVVAAVALPQPVALQGPEAPVEVVHGFEAPLPIKAVRAQGGEGVINLTPLPLPPGVAIANGKVDEKAGEATLTVKVAPEAAVGSYSVAITGKGKAGGKNVSPAAPAITLNVVRPAAVELASPNVEVKAGETVEVKGKLVRRGAFKEEVTLKLNGLPGGLKAEPVKLAADASEFVFKVTAEGNAPAASASAQVAMAFQLNKKDYNSPPVPLAVKVVAAK